MSLILGYANKNNAIIMSDGRAGGVVRPSENYDKTMRINDNIILGFAGIAETIEDFMNFTISQMGEDRPDYFINDFWELIAFQLEGKNVKKFLQSSFIIIGRLENGEMYTSIVGDCTNYSIESHKVDNARFLTIGGSIDGRRINEIYTKNIMRKDIPIQECMLKTIKEISLLDSSVNDNTFWVTI